MKFKIGDIVSGTDIGGDFHSQVSIVATSELDQAYRIQYGDIIRWCHENNLVLASSTLEPSVPAQEGLAERKNSGKPQLSMIDLKCLEPCAKVLEYGANKYARNNWKKGMPMSQLLDSLLRHIGDLQAGLTHDLESGELIIGHIQCNALFLGNSNNVQDL